MNPPVLLTDEEICHLRRYIAFHQRRGWWQRHSSVSLIPLPLFLLVASQFVGRWLPSHLAAQGMALCSSYPTLRRGLVWWPSEPDLRTVLQGISGLTLFCAFYMGALVAGTWVNDLRGQRISRILTRLYPEVGATETAATPTR